MNKRERDEYEKLLELCTRKDKELTEARHRIVELEVRLEEATTVREQHWATVRGLRADIKHLQDEVDAANRKVSAAQNMAEEGAIAAGNSSRVAVRLMEHLDEYVAGLRQEKK